MSLIMDFRNIYINEKQSRKCLYKGKRGTNKQQWLPTPQNNELSYAAKSKPKRKQAKEKAAARIQAACASPDDLDDHVDIPEGDFDGFGYTGQLDDSEILEFF